MLRVRFLAGPARDLFIFFSPELTLCADSYSVSVHSVLPQWHVKEPGPSAKSAGCRLHLNMHTHVSHVRLQEIPSGSVYKNSSKNKAKLSLVFGHFCQCDNEWFVHDFYIQAQGECQMCLSAVKLDHSGKLSWDTPSWLSAWVPVFWAWRMDLNKGVPRLFAYCEKPIWKCFFKFNQGTCPWMAFAWNFFRIFLTTF